MELLQPKLVALSGVAAWTATLAETAIALEDRIVDVPPDEWMLPDFTQPWPWDFDFMSIARHLVRLHHAEIAHHREQRIATWLKNDREHWPELRTTLIDPWQQRPGIWSEETPERVHTRGTTAAAAHEKYDPFGRRPMT